MERIKTRIDLLIDAAIQDLDECPVQAEFYAYEAGKYAWELDAATPHKLVMHPVLAKVFEQGKADVQKNYAAHTEIKDCVVAHD